MPSRDEVGSLSRPKNGFPTMANRGPIPLQPGLGTGNVHLTAFRSAGPAVEEDPRPDRPGDVELHPRAVPGA